MERDGLGLRCNIYLCGTIALREFLETAYPSGCVPLVEIRSKGNPNAEEGK